MVFSHFPDEIDQITLTNWETFAPYYDDLLSRDLNRENFKTWLSDWSRLDALINEAGTFIRIQKTQDTRNQVYEKAFITFVSEVQPQAAKADQKLKEKLLSFDNPVLGSGDLSIMLRNMRNQADLFNEDNVQIQTELSKLGNEYDKITGGLSAIWQGEEQNLNQLEVHLRNHDRSVREKAWRLMSGLWLGQRDELNELYIQMLRLRSQLAENSGLEDFREYTFRDYDRFDYSVDDCLSFHDAIERVVVPAATRVYSKKRERLGLETIRPWDMEIDTTGATRLQPYTGQAELVQGALNILQSIHPDLAHYFSIMAEEDLLDLDTRAGKALGGYCASLPLRQRPFIFMNGAGTHDDVQTLLHEAGHAFHVFETSSLPYIWQHNPPMEFAEVASMSMELFCSPYLNLGNGGFYSNDDSARARIEHLEGIILFLPYMAIVDAFQHWVYTNPQAAINAAACDQKWAELWCRFIPAVDFSGLEDQMETGWHRKLHIFQNPFYYIEYGFAQVGALQIWKNALHNQEESVLAYRKALSLGGTKTLPGLFKTAGIQFRFDEEMLHDLIDLLESKVGELEASL